MDEVELALGIQLRSMAVYLHFLVFEVDESDFDLSKLPGKVGGRISCWGIYGTVWNLDSAHMQRSNDPQTEGGDETDYRPDLQPGIKLCGEVQASSAGALLSNENTGEKVLMVAAHTFDLDNDNIVYHPDKPGRIGQLKTVDEGADWGFCTLDDGVNFANTDYLVLPFRHISSASTTPDERTDITRGIVRTDLPPGWCGWCLLGYIYNETAVDTAPSGLGHGTRTFYGTQEAPPVKLRTYSVGDCVGRLSCTKKMRMTFCQMEL